MYFKPTIPTPKEFWNLRSRVLHQGRTLTPSGAFYKFTKNLGTLVHRLGYGGDVQMLDVGEWSRELVASVHAWFTDLQKPSLPARVRM